jgi:hypothetical protein
MGSIDGERIVFASLAKGKPDVAEVTMKEKSISFGSLLDSDCSINWVEKD